MGWVLSVGSAGGRSSCPAVELVSAMTARYDSIGVAQLDICGTPVSAKSNWTHLKIDLHPSRQC